MIPEFPKFKHIELSDKDDVEKIIQKYPPYSDFNFVNIWSWDIKGEMFISILNENLVVRFTDYITNKKFYSFMGDKKTNETVKTLLEFSKKEGLEPKLEFVPEEAAKGLSKSNFDIVFERDAHDYIYSISHLSNMNHWTKHSSGKNIRSFVKKCPNYVVKHCSIKNAQKKEYIDMFKKWAENKNIKDYLELNEHTALKRIFETKYDNINLVSIYINNLLVGFTIYEILSDNYAISHFAKADTKYHRAIFDILNWEEAKILNKQGIKYFNWEPDLGIPGLRKSKEKYRPSFLFKKLTISYRDQKKL